MNLLVITENVNLNTMFVMSTMTVEITVMKKDVVCCIYKKRNHDIFSAQVKSSYECIHLTLFVFIACCYVVAMFIVVK